MLRVGIVGASGYTGVELARLLAGHPEVEITVATSRQYAGKPLAEVFPNLRKRVDVLCENLGAAELIDRADFFFTAKRWIGKDDVHALAVADFVDPPIQRIAISNLRCFQPVQQ